MGALEYLESVREAYVRRYRSVLQARREEGADCFPEIWVKPNGKPGDSTAPEPFCVDIIIKQDEGNQVCRVTDGAIEGTLAGVLDRPGPPVKVYSVSWDTFFLWLRHPEPDWAGLVPWREKWMNHERQDDADPDGLSGVVHFFGKPVAEGGGFLLELDLGSAPVDAVIELLDAVAAMGATEMEIGRSDGSDLPAEVKVALRQPDLAIEQLSEMVIQLLGQMDEVESARRIDEENVDFVQKGKTGSHHLNLNNLHRLLQRVGVEARPKELYRFMRGQREFMAPMEAPELSQLRAVIKDDRFVDNVRRLGPKMKPLVLKNLTADLWVVCVWDSPNGMRFATADEPETYGLSAEQLLQRGIENYVLEHPPAELSDHGPLRVARTNDSYDASLLLDDAWCQEVSEKVKGELLACVPARHLVLLGGTDEPGTADEMHHASARIEAGGDHLVSRTILVRREGKWEKYEPKEAEKPPVIATDSPAPALPALVPPKTKRPWWKIWKS